LNGTARVGLPWATLLAFVRIVSNHRAVQRAISVADAWTQVEAWLDLPPVWIPEPTDRHREVLGRLLRSQPLRANLVTDAHLAALAVEHGLTLCSADGDFARFRELRWENPLAQ
jgi:toxin-antitoxin system PIN domain toxin